MVNADLYFWYRQNIRGLTEFILYDDIHLKLVDWPLLVLGNKPIYETGPIYKSCVYFQLYRQNQQYFLFILIKLGNVFIFALSFAKNKKT